MTRLADAFSARAAKGQKALVVYLCVGDPSLDESVDLAIAAASAGADVLELGVPFSDPTADGPTIARAAQRAIRGGATLGGVLEVARKVRAKVATPIVLFTYYNPVLVAGEANVARRAREAGVDAFLVVDLPPEESASLRVAAKHEGLAMISLVAPTSDDARVDTILGAELDGAPPAFIYYVSLTGVTGSAAPELARASVAAERLRARSKLPVAVGFGIDGPEAARAAAGAKGAGADGVVVGTALVKRIIESGKTPDARVASVHTFVARASALGSDAATTPTFAWRIARSLQPPVVVRGSAVRLVGCPRRPKRSMGPDKSSPLVSLALDGIARLDGDDAKEDALKTLGNVLAGTAFAPELAEVAFERLLRLSLSLDAPWTRSRAFADACVSIGCSRAPRELRAAVLERALGLADDAETPLERIERARAATQALGALRHDDEVVERLEKLGADASSLGDARVRVRTIAQIALAIAEAGEHGRSVALLDQLAPSASRARAMVLVARHMHATGDVDEAVALVEATIGEVRAEPESYEQALALRSILEVLIETGMVLPTGNGIGQVLSIVDELHDARFKKDALLGVIDALPRAAVHPEQLAEIMVRLRASIDRVEDTYTRAPLQGDLANALAARGDVEGAARALDGVLKIATSRDTSDLVDTLGDPEAALPIPKILSALASDENPRVVHEFAMHALAMVRERRRAGDDRQHHSPGRRTSSRAPRSRTSLDRPPRSCPAWVAQSLRSPDHCVDAVHRGRERALARGRDRGAGDCLFAGLVIGIDPRLARKAHLERAIALTRLGRVPDAREQLVAAAEKPGGDSWHAIEELAQACARCGFIGDLLDVLARDRGASGRSRRAPRSPTSSPRAPTSIPRCG